MKKYLVAAVLIVSFAARFRGGDLRRFRSRESQMLDDAQPANAPMRAWAASSQS